MIVLAQAGASTDGLLGPFTQYSPLHFLVVALLITGIVSACVLGRRLLEAGPAREARFRRTLAFVIFAWMSMETTYYLFARPWDPAVSLPLHFCDIGAWLAPVMLLTRARLLRAILYYWTITFTIQAYITPTLTEGPTQWRFYLFWMSHTWIIGAGVYDLAVLRFRPAWRDFFQATGATVLLVLFLVFAVNMPFGLNYGFLGQSTPERPTIIDALGPWPERVWVMSFASIAVFAVLTALWPANWTRRKEALAS
ncbi:MAG: TIGR02206 family membrane protein [Planctomycetota bacterium]|nr:TIGR02206 family membrane protein [Planctomycetota bacterium]